MTGLVQRQVCPERFASTLELLPLICLVPLPRLPLQTVDDPFYFDNAARTINIRRNLTGSEADIMFYPEKSPYFYFLVREAEDKEAARPAGDALMHIRLADICSLALMIVLL
jgi:hypothetical protein